MKSIRIILQFSMLFVAGLVSAQLTVSNGSPQSVNASSFSVTLSDPTGFGTCSSTTVPTVSIRKDGITYFQGSSASSIRPSQVTSFSATVTKPIQSLTVTAGTYDVSVTGGCASRSCADCFTFYDCSLLNVTASSQSLTCAGANDGIVSANVSGGTAPFSYQWSNGSTVNGIVEDSLSLTSLSAGSYTVSITDANGCSRTSNTIFVSQPSSLQLTGTTQNVLCNGGNDGSANYTAFGGTQPYSFEWSNGDNTGVADSLEADSYTVTVTDRNGCQDTESISISEPSAISIDTAIADVLCNGEANGAIDLTVVGGAGGYGYVWSNGSSDQDISQLSAGEYRIVVTDRNGCKDSLDAIVTEPDELMASIDLITGVSCNGENDGELEASASGGTPPYTYTWDDFTTDSTLAGLEAGDFFVVVQDANGCIDTTEFTLTQPAELTVSIVVDSNVSCAGFSDGGLTATVSGGTADYDYAWTNSAGSTATVTDLQANFYELTVTDANGCEAIETEQITEPSELRGEIIVDSNVSCNGDADGGLTASVDDGTPGYTYTWDNGGSGESLTGLSSNVYAVTVTDANGCVLFIEEEVTEPSMLELVISVDSNVSCNGDTDGGISATASGGAGGYNYDWSNQELTESITNLVAGKYVLLLSDANGCELADSVNVTEPDEIELSAVVLEESTNGAADGEIDLTVVGGTGNYDFDWDNDGSGDIDDTEDLSGLEGGTYSVMVTDENGCDVTQSFEVGIDVITAFDEITSRTEVSLFPNPITSGKAVNFSSLMNEVSVMDHTGRVLFEVDSASTISTEGMASGWYIVKSIEGEFKLLVKE